MGSESIAHLLLNSFTHITLNKLKYLPENQDHLFFLHVKTKLEAFLSVLEHSANYNKCGFKNMCYNNRKHASLIYRTKLYENDS